MSRLLSPNELSESMARDIPMFHQKGYQAYANPKHTVRDQMRQMILALASFGLFLVPAYASAQQSCSERSTGRDQITCTFVPTESGTYALNATTIGHSTGNSLWVGLMLTVSKQKCGFKEANWSGSSPVQIKTGCQASLDQGKTYTLNAVQQNKGGSADSIKVEISFEGSGGAALPITPEE
jgi:hypothetical protein